MRRRPQSDALVLNADNAAPQRLRLAREAQVFWFQPNTPVGRARWSQDGWVVYRACRAMRQAEPVMPVSEIPLKGEHNVENVLAAVCAARLAGVAARRFARAVDGLPGGRAPAGVCGDGERRGVLQRLEGHECGCDGEGDGGVSRRDSPDPGRQGQGLGLHGSGRSAAGAGERGLHDWFGGGEDRAQLRGVVSLHSCETLEEAVAAAGPAARPGEVVLLAPACSSFDQFENYEHRGQVFKELVARATYLESEA